MSSHDYITSEGLQRLIDITCDPSLQDEELYQLFCSIPNLGTSVEAVRVVRDPHLNVGKGIAYVLFKTKVGCFGARIAICFFYQVCSLCALKA